jgi:class 3 adenylate cyclase
MAATSSAVNRRTAWFTCSVHRHQGQHRALDRDRIAMATRVERHFTLLLTAIEAHGGVLFKTVGDAVQTSFRTAPGAIAAAVAAK